MPLTAGMYAARDCGTISDTHTCRETQVDHSSNLTSTSYGNRHPALWAPMKRARCLAALQSLPLRSASFPSILPTSSAAVADEPCQSLKVAFLLDSDCARSVVGPVAPETTHLEV